MKQNHFGNGMGMNPISLLANFGLALAVDDDDDGAKPAGFLLAAAFFGEYFFLAAAIDFLAFVFAFAPKLKGFLLAAGAFLAGPLRKYGES